MGNEKDIDALPGKGEALLAGEEWRRPCVRSSMHVRQAEVETERYAFNFLPASYKQEGRYPEIA